MGGESTEGDFSKLEVNDNVFTGGGTLSFPFPNKKNPVKLPSNNLSTYAKEIG